MGHVSANIGGHYITNHSIEETNVQKYAPVPKDKQKAALAFLNEQLFQKPEWLVNVPYIWDITDSPDSFLYPLVDNVVSSANLLSIGKLGRLQQFAQYDSSNYTPEEYLYDLENYVFAELGRGGKVDSYRRYLQNRYVTQALEVVNSDAGRASDARNLLTGQLLDIQKKASKAKPADKASRAHWQAISLKIEKGLK